MKRLHQIGVALLTGCVLLVAAGPAAADVPARNEAVHVYNSSGTPLADVDIYDRTTQEVLATTDGNGVTQIQIQENCWNFGGNDVPEDQQCGYPNQYDGITATRSDGSGDPCETAPEYFPGVDFPIGSWGYGSINVVLPTVPGSPYQPALSSEERGLVGVINRARAEEGMAPLTISTVLTASADKYLGSVPARKLDYGQDAIYCENSGPGIRAADAGFPTSEGIGESVLQGDGNAASAFFDLQEDPHQDALQNDAATLIGIAQKGGTWVIDTSDLPTNSRFYARAGDTGDTGDAGLVASEFPAAPNASGDGEGPQTEKKARDPHLKISKLSTRGRAVHLALALSPKAKGTVKATAVSKRSKKDKVPLHVSRHGGTVKVTGHLHPGRWTVKARFIPNAGTQWQAAAVTHRLFVRN